MPVLTATSRAARVAVLNDAFRRTFTGGRVFVTAGVAALPESTRTAAFATVRAFDRFDANNDPHGEHDFGPVVVGDLRVFWKIDAYDRALAFSARYSRPCCHHAGADRHADRGVLM